MKGYWLELTSELVVEAYKNYADALGITIDELEDEQKQAALLNHVMDHPDQSETDDWLGKLK